MFETAGDAKTKAMLGAVVSEDDAIDIKDREDEVAELISKLQAKLKGPLALSDVKKTTGQLAKQVLALAVYVKSTTIPTGLAIPQRKLGAGECVVHAAGVLQDGLIVPNLQKAGDMFSKVYGAKAHGAWTLHCAMAAL